MSTCRITRKTTHAGTNFGAEAEKDGFEKISSHLAHFLFFRRFASSPLSKKSESNSAQGGVIMRAIRFSSNLNNNTGSRTDNTMQMQTPMYEYAGEKGYT